MFLLAKKKKIPSALLGSAIALSMLLFSCFAPCAFASEESEANAPSASDSAESYFEGELSLPESAADMLDSQDEQTGSFQGDDPVDIAGSDESVNEEQEPDDQSMPSSETVGVSADNEAETSEPASDDPLSENVVYRAHVQYIGWQDWVQDGEVAGTSGEARRMEAVEFLLEGPYDGEIFCQAHVQNIGWQRLEGTSAGDDPALAGTSGEALRMEAFKFTLAGEVSSWYDIVYRAHVQGIGWQDWVRNGEIAGTSGQSLRVEALQVKLVAKSGQTEESDGGPGIVYQTHVQYVGWQDQKASGEVAGTSGEGRRMEAAIIWLDNAALDGSLEYRAHVQYDGWQDWVSSGEMTGTSGKSLRMEALQIVLTGEIATLYDVVYRVHVQNVGWQPWVVNGAVAGTSGEALRVEALRVTLIAKGAYEIAEGAYLISCADDVGVLVSAADDEALATSSNCVDQSQKFYFREEEPGAYSIESMANGTFLTDNSGVIAQEAFENGNANQLWSVSWDAGAVLVNLATGNAFMIADNAVSSDTPDTGNANQHLAISDVRLIEDGIYIISLAIDPSEQIDGTKILDVKDASRRVDASVILFSANGGNNQKFEVVAVGDDVYRISGAVTKHVLEDVSRYNGIGCGVRMLKSTGANTQKWRAEYAGASSFSFVNLETGLVLSIRGGSQDAGAKVVTYSPEDAERKAFRLEKTKVVREIVILDVPVIYQYPDLPTGCESVALTEALNYYGFGLSKCTIADYYMPWSGSDFVYAFLGNPHSSAGNAIMAPGITITANSFLRDVGSDMRATNLTGISFSSLYEYLDRGVPVVVWNTIDCASPSGPYLSKDGYSLYYPSHAVTLAGYNPFDNTVYIADPISGWVERDADWFATVYNRLGKQAVIVE